VTSIPASIPLARPTTGSPPPSPKPRLRAKRLWCQVRDYAVLRCKFANLWIRRGLGLVQPKTLDPALLHHGLTFVLPGIESESIFTYGMCDGLLDGGVPGQIRVFNWGLPFPGGYLANLTRIDRNRRRARDLAMEIVAYQDAFPGRPVHLVAQSGGAGIAVFAAEALPEGRSIDGIVLLGGALSPTYNLAPALRKTKKGLLNSHSCKDTFILNWGTRIFGTTDRQFTRAAGCTGFTPPENLSPEDQTLYTEKLHQLPWREEMADTCHHWGGHIASGGELFLAKHIAPWIVARQPAPF
jgi:pimeloyl-ACP methyl ester carboxylesterase